MEENALPLRDLHLPEAIGWWPLAPGWWVLLAMLVGQVVLTVTRVYSADAAYGLLSIFCRWVSASALATVKVLVERPLSVTRPVVKLSSRAYCSV